MFGWLALSGRSFGPLDALIAACRSKKLLKNSVFCCDAKRKRKTLITAASVGFFCKLIINKLVKQSVNDRLKRRQLRFLRKLKQCQPAA